MSLTTAVRSDPSGALLLPRARRLFAGFVVLAAGVQLLEWLDAETPWWPDRAVALVAIAALAVLGGRVASRGRFGVVDDATMVGALTLAGLGLGRNGAVLVALLAVVPLRTLHGRRREVAAAVVGLLAGYAVVTVAHHGIGRVVADLGFLVVVSAIGAFAVTLRRLAELLAAHDLRARLDAVATEHAVGLVGATCAADVAALEALALDHVRACLREAADEPTAGTGDAADRVPGRVRERDLAAQDASADPVAGVLARLVAEGRLARQRAESEARYRIVAEGSRDGIYLRELHPRPGYRYLNPAAERMLGVDAATLTADPALARRLVHEDDRTALSEAAAGAGYLAEATHVRCRCPDGILRWFALHEHPVVVDDDARAVLGTVRDVTAEHAESAALSRLAERERAAADELRHLDAMKSTFLQAVSHELRTPLSAVIGAAQTLEAHDVRMDADQRQRMLEIVRRQSARLERLLTDLLDVDRLSRGLVAPERHPTDLRALADRVLHAVGPGAERIEVTGDPVVVAVDAAKVERIVDNLLRNALRHTPVDGRIVCVVSGDGDGASVVVEDEGPGVPDELKTELFRPFAQGPSAGSAPSPGTGIGLTLVRALAELHDGHAWIADRPGGGARIGVWFPHAPADASAAAASGPAAADGPPVPDGTHRSPT